MEEGKPTSQNCCKDKICVECLFQCSSCRKHSTSGSCYHNEKCFNAGPAECTSPLPSKADTSMDNLDSDLEVMNPSVAAPPPPFGFLELGLDNGPHTQSLFTLTNDSLSEPPSWCSCSLSSLLQEGSLSSSVLKCSGFWSLICLTPSSFGQVQFIDMPAGCGDSVSPMSLEYVKESDIATSRILDTMLPLMWPRWLVFLDSYITLLIQ